MIKEFGGDYRILRVVMESKDPLETLHNIRTGKYSIITLLDMIELLDVRDTIREDEEYRMKVIQKNSGRK